MSQPLVSVIMAVYNGSRFLAETLQSIHDQDYGNFEIIAIDDGSTDNSADIIRSFKNVKYFHQPNSGVAAARNKGIKLSSGDIVAFIDQDDQWKSNKLSLQVQYLINNPDIFYVIAKQHIFLEPGEDIPSWLKEELLNRDHAGFLPGTLVARKTVFQKIGMFNTEYVTASDVDWFFRAKDNKVPMFHMPDVVLDKRIHDANQSFEVKDLHSEYLKILRESITRQKQIKNKEREE